MTEPVKIDDAGKLQPSRWILPMKAILAVLLFLKMMPPDRIPHFLRVMGPIALGVGIYWWLVLRWAKRSTPASGGHEAKP